MLAALLLAGCSADDSTATPDATQGGEICLAIKSEQLLKGDTRATTIDSNTELQEEDISIDAYFNDTETKYLDGVKLKYSSAWKFWNGDPGSETHYYWPIEGSEYTTGPIPVSSLDFVGFCPYTTPAYITTPTYNHSTGASFSVTMPTEKIESVDYMTNAAQTSMEEYLIAVLNNQTYATQTAAGGAIPLVFKHPFALIKFVIAEGSGTNVQVNSISIDDLYTTATCTYDGSTMTWEDHDDEVDMTITQTLKVGETEETTPLIVIPNDYGAKTLTVNGTWDDWSNVTHDISTNVDINWEPGYIYTYNLTVTKYALKVDVAKYTEQW